MAKELVILYKFFSEIKQTKARILHLDKVYQFPTTKVLKKRAKNNQFFYDATLEYEEKGTLKKKVIRIRIQPKLNKMLGYEFYKAKCEEIFNEFDKVLKIE